MKHPGIEVPDAELVTRARRGESSAFEALVRRHYRAAFAVAVALSGNAMDAEDVCQDAFVKALERLEDCRNPDRFAAWLLQIVRNRAHNFREYQRVRVGLQIEKTDVAGSSDAAAGAEQSELRARLEEALAELTDAQRQIVLLHDMEGWKHKAIAEALDMSVESSRQHLFVARRALRKHLGAHALEEHFHE